MTHAVFVTVWASRLYGRLTIEYSVYLRRNTFWLRSRPSTADYLFQVYWIRRSLVDALRFFYDQLMPSLFSSDCRRNNALRNTFCSYGLMDFQRLDSLLVSPQAKHHPFGLWYLQTSMQGLSLPLLMQCYRLNWILGPRPLQYRIPVCVAGRILRTGVVLGF